MSEAKEYEQLGKSPFQQLCMEDCVEYTKLYTKYERLKADNINGELANQVANRALILASRWSEISTHASDVKARYGFIKQDFWQWAHEHYSTLKEIHVHARGLWKEANEQLREQMKYGGGV